MIKSLIAASFVLSAVFVSSNASARSLEMLQVEQIVQSLEKDYSLNIRLIPQSANSEKLWLQDLKFLANVLDNKMVVPEGSVRYLTCDKLVCRGN